LYTNDILNYSNKIKNVSDIIIYFDLIIDIVKDDVKNIVISKRIYFFDFDYIFNESAKILKNQLEKKHLHGIQNFYSSANLNVAVSWMIARLINNMKNISTNPKYKDFISVKFVHGYKNFHHLELDIDTRTMIDELHHLPMDKIKRGLKKVYEKNQLYQDFDLEDFESLCNQFSINCIDIIGYDPRERPKVKAELTKSGNSQLILFFDDQN
jgi:hypothetical protein